MSSPPPQPDGAVPQFAPWQYLDWHDRRHWSDQERPCRLCGKPTHLRDEDRKPAHKTCVEAATDAQNAALANRYQGVAE